MEAVIGLLVILARLALLYIQSAQAKKASTYENDTAKFSQAVAAGNADDLSRMFDGLSVPPAGDGDPGGPDDPAACQWQLRGDTSLATGTVQGGAMATGTAEGVR